ncbi:uncharacterized protein CLUP02_09390 [Colletotrichum lupini]|uniref:Uncharacterized protein n=1 Tax=Colletotrichum lupini TaxID=145971 RepID=A0A9Q8SUL7_9PEZI|nr:uncharacterized protein CLUP02_09390 [Colletotrichum lupini]UQC83894.1 hypothetical protein CLUP02_09390 [Colletotrichum lupini]
MWIIGSQRSKKRDSWGRCMSHRLASSLAGPFVRLEGELGSRPTSRKGKRDDHHKERQHCGLTTFQHMPRGVRDKSPCWVFPFSAVVSEGRRCPSIGHHLSILTAQSLKLLSPTTQSPTNGVVLKLTCYLNSTEVPTRLAYTIPSHWLTADGGRCRAHFSCDALSADGSSPKAAGHSMTRSVENASQYYTHHSMVGTPKSKLVNLKQETRIILTTKWSVDLELSSLAVDETPGYQDREIRLGTVYLPGFQDSRGDDISRCRSLTSPHRPTTHAAHGPLVRTAEIRDYQVAPTAYFGPNQLQMSYTSPCGRRCREYPAFRQPRRDFVAPALRTVFHPETLGVIDFQSSLATNLTFGAADAKGHRIVGIRICQEVCWSLIMIQQSQTTTICPFTFHAAKIGWWSFWTACSACDLDLENAVCLGESKLDNVNFANSVLWQHGAGSRRGSFLIHPNEFNILCFRKTLILEQIATYSDMGQTRLEMHVPSKARNSLSLPRFILLFFFSCSIKLIVPNGPGTPVSYQAEQGRGGRGDPIHLLICLAFGNRGRGKERMGDKQRRQARQQMRASQMRGNNLIPAFGVPTKEPVPAPSRQEEEEHGLDQDNNVAAPSPMPLHLDRASSTARSSAESQGHVKKMWIDCKMKGNRLGWALRYPMPPTTLRERRCLGCLLFQRRPIRSSESGDISWAAEHIQRRIGYVSAHLDPVPSHVRSVPSPQARRMTDALQVFYGVLWT